MAYTVDMVYTADLVYPVDMWTWGLRGLLSKKSDGLDWTGVVGYPLYCYEAVSDHDPV